MVNSQLSRAISERRLVKLIYHHPHSRIVEPHAYGQNHLGHDLLRCYQISGPSR